MPIRRLDFRDMIVWEKSTVDWYPYLQCTVQRSWNQEHLPNTKAHNNIWVGLYHLNTSSTVEVPNLRKSKVNSDLDGTESQLPRSSQSWKTQGQKDNSRKEDLLKEIQKRKKMFKKGEKWGIKENSKGRKVLYPNCLIHRSRVQPSPNYLHYDNCCPVALQRNKGLKRWRGSLESPG